MARPDPYRNYDGWRLWHPDEDSVQCTKCGRYVDPENIANPKREVCFDCDSLVIEEDGGRGNE